MRAFDGDFEVTQRVPRELWQSIFESDPASMVSQSPAWHDALIGTGQYRDVSLLFEFGSGRQVLLPLAQRHWWNPLEPVAASWPHRWGVGGPMSSDGRVDPAEAAAVLGHLARQGLFGGEIHLSHAAAPVWLREARRFRVLKEPCYVVDLTGGFEEVWQRKFSRTIRQAVRKAERSGLDVQIDRSGKLLGTFYDLYERSMPRWSATVHEPLWFTKWNVTRATPMKMLSSVAEHLGDACTTWVARYQGDPVAAIIVLQTGSRCECWKAAMDKQRAAPLRAFQLLHRLAIETACKNGCISYGMGVAEPGSALAESKRRIGAALLFTHYLQAERLPIHKATDRSKRLIRETIFGRSQ